MSGPERAGAYIFIGDRQRSVTEWKHQLGTTDEQMEIFLLKYPDMDRDNLKYIIEVRRYIRNKVQCHHAAKIDFCLLSSIHTEFIRI